MVKVALFIRVEATPSKKAQVEELLTGGLPLVNDTIDNLVVTLDDRNLSPHQMVLSGQVIYSNVSIVTSISADASGQGHAGRSPTAARDATCAVSAAASGGAGVESTAPDRGPANFSVGDGEAVLYFRDARSQPGGALGLVTLCPGSNAAL